MKFFRERAVSAAASDLIQFDADSIRQVVSAHRRADPDIWLADPDAYEMNGRLLRDSETPRMLAYSTQDQTLYATDGCNSCARRLHTKLDLLTPGELRYFAENNELRLDLLERIIALVRAG